MLYCMTQQPGGWNSAPTVVYTNHLCEGAPEPPDAAVLAWLFARQRAPIRRVVVGHQPHGDAPLIIRSPLPCHDDGSGDGGDFVIVTGDTSYSGFVKHLPLHEGEGGEELLEGCAGEPRFPGDTRGPAVSEIVLEFAGDGDGEGDAPFLIRPLSRPTGVITHGDRASFVDITS